MTLKELKIAHRNQTILTGGSGSSNCDDDIPFDFGAVVTAAGTKRTTIANESMELDRCVMGKSAHTDRDIEMETIVESLSTKPAVRPTTLNIPGGATQFFLFVLHFNKKKHTHTQCLQYWKCCGFILSCLFFCVMLYIYYIFRVQLYCILRFKYNVDMSTN